MRRDLPLGFFSIPFITLSVSICILTYGTLLAESTFHIWSWLHYVDNAFSVLLLLAVFGKYCSVPYLKSLYSIPYYLFKMQTHPGKKLAVLFSIFLVIAFLRSHNDFSLALVYTMVFGLLAERELKKQGEEVYDIYPEVSRD